MPEARNQGARVMRELLAAVYRTGKLTIKIPMNNNTTLELKVTSDGKVPARYLFPLSERGMRKLEKRWRQYCEDNAPLSLIKDSVFKY